MNASLVDKLAQEIRRVDGNNTLGAGALAEAIISFITDTLAAREDMKEVGRVRCLEGRLFGYIWKESKVEIGQILYAPKPQVAPVKGEGE